MKLILNVGLKVDATGAIWHQAHALDIVEHHFCSKALAHAVVQSDTEPTLVVELDLKGARGVIHAGELVAHSLSQTCIAAYAPDHDMGKLIGPGAAAWGAFNPEHFLLLDGSRLSDQLAPTQPSTNDARCALVV